MKAGGKIRGGFPKTLYISRLFAPAVYLYVTLPFTQFPSIEEKIYCQLLIRCYH